MQTNPIILFLKEWLPRLQQKTPKFFKILGTISLIAAMIGGVPEFLKYIGVEMPAWSTGFYNKLLLAAGVWGKIVSMLPTENPQNLPYTNKDENQP